MPNRRVGMGSNMTTTIKCPRCWKPAPASAAFCRRCGAALHHLRQPPPLPRRHVRAWRAFLVWAAIWMAGALALGLLVTARRHRPAAAPTATPPAQVLPDDAEHSEPRWLVPAPAASTAPPAVWVRPETPPPSPIDSAERTSRAEARPSRAGRTVRELEDHLAVIQYQIGRRRFQHADRLLEELEAGEDDLTPAMRERVRALRGMVDTQRTAPPAPVSQPPG